ncbi:MAG: RnfABCDGE type electron transport complex subunit G [Desulfovibrio sp.]
MRDILRMVAVLSLICAISGYALATIKDATKERIEMQVLTYVQGPAIQAVLSLAENNPIADRKTVKMQSGTQFNVFPAKKEGKVVAVALEAFAPGYSGDIGVMVGFNLADDTLTGIGITTQTETPGLGTRIAEPAFTRLFDGHGMKKLDLSSRDGDIDAISGATFSSVGTVDAVKKAAGVYMNNKNAIESAFAGQ